MLGRAWLRSSFSANDTCCVEVKKIDDEILVRDSKFLRNAENDPNEQPMLAYTADEWKAFVAGVKAGEFDI